MPKMFEVPGRPAPEGYTFLRTFVGPHAALPDRPPPLTIRPGRPTERRRITAFNDGLSHILIVAEAAEAVPWTKHDELPFPGTLGGPDPIPVPKLGGGFPGGFYGLMADSEVRFFPATLSADALRSLITIDGGEVLTGEAERAVFPNGRPAPPPPGVPNGKTG